MVRLSVPLTSWGTPGTLIPIRSTWRIGSGDDCASLLSVPAKEVQELFSTSVHPRGMTVLSESWLPFPFLYRTSAQLIEMISLARSLSISPLNPPPEGATTELGLNSSPNSHPLLSLLLRLSPGDRSLEVRSIILASWPNKIRESAHMLINS